MDRVLVKDDKLTDKVVIESSSAEVVGTCVILPNQNMSLVDEVIEDCTEPF